jgi:hypothetical protein
MGQMRNVKPIGAANKPQAIDIQKQFRDIKRRADQIRQEYGSIEAYQVPLP